MLINCSNMPRILFVLYLKKRRELFFCKYVMNAIKKRDNAGIAEGLLSLLSMDYEFKKYWRIAARAYTNSEGKKIDLLFKHSFGDAFSFRKSGKQSKIPLFG